MNKQKGFSALEGLLIVLVIAIVGFGGWYVWNKNQEEKIPSTSISSYEQCVASGYPVMESYPEQCKVPDGQTFVRINSKENLTKAEEPEVKWAEYLHEGAHVKFNYPNTWTHEIQNESKDKEGHILIVKGLITSPKGTQIKWSYDIGGKGGGQICFPTENDVPFFDTVENCIPTQLSNIEVTQPATVNSTGLYIDHRRYEQKDSTSYNICLNSYNYIDGVPEASVFYRENLGLPCNATAPMAHVLLTDSEATNPELVKTIEDIFKSFRITL